MMRSIVTIKFGSHLYGTTTPASDVDYKSIHIPSSRDILMQRVKGSVNTVRPKKEKEKNLPGEIEEESYSLHYFLKLASEGQTVAMDVLFAPEWSMVARPSEEWLEIMRNRDKLVTRKAASFVGYCRTQANKYGIKGSRVAAARQAFHLLEAAVIARGTTVKLHEISDEIKASVEVTEHTDIEQIEQIGGQVIDYWNVCGRKLQFTATIKHARDVVNKLVSEYGQRAIQAENQQGVDWKALSHAVRVGTEAIELLRTGNITFPLLNAEHVLSIKLGKLPYQVVSSEIEELLVRVEEESERSSLPNNPNYEWIEDFTVSTYKRECYDS